MTILLPTLALAFSALGVWLAVRIVNRKERWAKWIAVGLVLVLAYPLSFGPACWIVSRTDCGHRVFSEAYRPLACAAWNGPSFIWDGIRTYARWGMAPGYDLFRAADADGQFNAYAGFEVGMTFEW